ncbi:uncharacterized protein KZ484_002165 [Pholidichthys leucotaenia]
MERERQRRLEEMERESQRRLEEERERLRQEEMERERQRRLEEEMIRERLRKEERERRLEEERMRERLRKDEMERCMKLEEERLRERLRQEEEEMRERLRQEMELEREKMRERLRQEEEIERKRRELENRMQEEEREKERMRQMERQREEERRQEEIRRQIEREQKEELERRQAEEPKEKLGLENERKGKEHMAVEDGQNLISFNSRDVAPAPFSPTLIDVVYDDFSVKKPLLEVEFDDFSVKPITPVSLVKTETAPVSYRWEAEPVDEGAKREGEEEMEMLVPLNATTQNVIQEQEETPGSDPAKSNKEIEEVKCKDGTEEEQLVSMEVERENEGEETGMEKEPKEQHKWEEQLNSYSPNDEDKDTEARVNGEPDRQDGVCEETSEIHSPQNLPNQDLKISLEDAETAESHTEPELTFPESTTLLLDTSAQRSKADLGKRRIRSRPSRVLRAGLEEKVKADWMTRDSTDQKDTSPKESESDSEEEQPKSKVAHTQRVPVFPGLSPSDLLAQVKKRSVRLGTEAREEMEEETKREEKESQNEEVTPSPSQLSRSPRSAAHMAGAALVLPPIGTKDGGGAASPAWLKELKTKKRFSQQGGSDA